jgi:hypothetical protein
MTGPGAAVGFAALGAVASALLNAVFAVTIGLVAVSGVTGYLVGAALRTPLADRAGDRPTGGAAAGAGGRPTAASRSNRIALAVLVALVAVLAGALGAWLVAIPQGNLLGPIDYLGQTLGIVLPVQAVAAIVGAWLGSR